jgi:hypothetical protein
VTQECRAPGAGLNQMSFSKVTNSVKWNRGRPVTGSDVSQNPFRFELKSDPNGFDNKPPDQFRSGQAGQIDSFVPMMEFDTVAGEQLLLDRRQVDFKPSKLRIENFDVRH